MSDSVFPSFPLLGRAMTRTPFYRTKIQMNGAEGELRVRRRSAARYRYHLSIDLLRQAGAFTEVQQILDFLDQHKGAWDSFLFTDPYDGAQRRVRFDSDELELTWEANGAWSAKTVVLVTVYTEGGTAFDDMALYQ
jgi:phage-related protein